MHEQSEDKIVEKLTPERAKEILNDKVKMDILNMLSNSGPESFGGILKKLGISQQAGTNHIFELKLLGLIEKNIDPPNYNINAGRYATLIEYGN